MVRAAFERFIRNAGRHGLPVRFLREVAQSDYTFVKGWESQVFPTLDLMMLEETDLASLKASSGVAIDATRGVLNIYHESTHAWLDLKKDQQDVRLLIKEGSKHYQNAPLAEHRVADDPDRVFQEAMGEYVGHRVSRYWHVWATLVQFEAALASKKSMNERSIAIALKTVKEARVAYDREMGIRVFGYQNQGWLGERQKTTLRTMTGKMKDFADWTLLEGKIPDAFLRADNPYRIWEKLRREYYPRLEG